MYKLSAEDIVNQSFERSFRGYDPDQVEEFLVAVAREWEHLRSELEKAREEVDEKSRRLEQYEQRQESLQEALEMAKRVSDEIKEKAEREAELKVADAEVEAEQIVAEAERRADELREDIRTLEKQRKRYAAEVKSLLQSHLDFVEELEGEDSSIRRAPEPPNLEAEGDGRESETSDSDPVDDESGEAVAVDDEDIECEQALREPTAGDVPREDPERDSDPESAASQSHPPINDSVH